MLYNLPMQKKIKVIWFGPILLLLVIGLYYIPPIHSRLAWRLDDLRAQIKFFFNPPNQVVFQPTQQVDFESILATTRAEYSLTLTPQATGTPVPTQMGATLTPTITPTPLPATVKLDGFKYVDQHNRWNYCGPANLTMALNFWGWKGNPDDIAKVIKPGENDPNKNFIERGKIDKNVMPYEMADFVNENTEFSALFRAGGDLNLLKSFIAAGYPMLIEKGYYEVDASGITSWMGHYQFITSYDDASKVFIVQDTYLDGPNFKISYANLYEGWRDFNYLFMVVYPRDKEQEIHHLLGNWSDEKWANQHALDLANKEVTTLTGPESFFAWFNKGTSHVELQEYFDAATAYDQAFLIYATLDKVKRPYRMLWYQTGPYKAYYYSARYADVINLAKITLDSVIGGPYLEESLLWRGRAYYMAGDTPNAIKDFRAALYVHPQWPPAMQALQDLGVQP